jgi:hypothetical protein
LLQRCVPTMTPIHAGSLFRSKKKRQT